MPDLSHLQRQVNVAVAHNVWQYFETTLHMDFLARHGAAIIFEVTRLFASMTSQVSGTDRYAPRGVVGPDEFHYSDVGSDRPAVDNNAYTHAIAAWVHVRAVRLLDR